MANWYLVIIVFYSGHGVSVHSIPQHSRNVCLTNKAILDKDGKGNMFAGFNTYCLEQ
jgi:hypothetical protein